MTDEDRWSVVLADDNDDLRILVARLLRRDGRFEVVAEATDGHQAIEAAASHQPDALLLDLAMPVMDGVTALPRIREASPDTKIVILTGHDVASLGAEDVYLEADGFLEKGAALDMLTETLARVCKGSTTLELEQPDELELPDEQDEPGSRG